MEIEKVLKKINVTPRGDGKFSINPSKELALGEYIELTKINETAVKEFEKDFGQGPKKSYLWVQQLDDIEVSFFLTPKQNQALIETGKLGDKIVVTKVEGQYQNTKTKVKLIYETLSFEVKGAK
jgi:hypothetical protein